MSLTTDAQPTLSSLLRGAAELALRQARVAIPAVVVSFDAGKATCAAQPLIAEPLAEGGHRTDPAVTNVPVLYPGTATSRVRFPLTKGDTVLLVFLDRASDDWALSLQLAEATSPKLKLPAECRRHDYTDAVAIPIATCAPSDLSVAADRLLMEHGGAQLALVDGNKVAFGTATVELLDRLDALIGALQTAIVDVLGAPALGAAAQATLTSIRASLTSIRGTL